MTYQQFADAIDALLERIGLHPDLRDAARKLATDLPHTEEALKQIELGWQHQRVELRGENN